ncbi:uncharacterized protein LOC113271482 isoform X1 [Papaver somniferum]|uniref:uncharacterized protein LOC113271482 isoform X1 n=1 Tax=Papaver somniferum TaxID=3469 RepID=UPI000E70472B|nr:uncharacterized protein LOC113271482 isoform X1 [Papaver somniferum]
MAAICCIRVSTQPSPASNLRFQCWGSSKNKRRDTAPYILKIAMSGITEILRIFSPSNPNRTYLQQGLDTAVNNVKIDETSVSGIDDVVSILQSDYENAYFLTGNFSSAIYTEDCIFEDPTIKFSGRDLYSRNLKLLVPFFDSPSLVLQQIEKDMSSELSYVLATWKLRTYLRLPWRPLISIEGSTVYDLNDEFKIFRHCESWNISALEAVGQIFNFSFESSGE